MRSTTPFPLPRLVREALLRGSSAFRRPARFGPLRAALPAGQSLADGGPGPAGEAQELIARDGYRLGATLYEPSGPARANLIIAGAIGVSQRHYRRAARYAARAGWRTLTLDYRGVGRSAPRRLRGFEMDYLDWGRLDLDAAVTRMARPGERLFVLGHSYAGHGFGALPDPGRVDAFFTFGSGAGWHGWMPPLERLKVLTLWHGLAPVFSRAVGYLPMSVVGMGEDLPLEFYRQWKHWCSHPRFFLEDAGMSEVVEGFGRIELPIMAANSIDDRWTPPPSRNAFMTGYRRAAVETLDLRPADFGMKGIGHMGYFRSDASRLWDLALAWFDRTVPETASSSRN